jgi:hypothetical protein
LRHGLALLVLLAVPEIASAQAERESGPSTGRRHFIEQAERERQQRQRWEVEEEEFRRRAKIRQRQREEYIQQRRQGDATPAPEPTVVP